MNRNRHLNRNRYPKHMTSAHVSRCKAGKKKRKGIGR